MLCNLAVCACNEQDQNERSEAAAFRRMVRVEMREAWHLLNLNHTGRHFEWGHRQAEQ
jgi:hypothetical protein